MKVEYYMDESSQKFLYRACDILVRCDILARPPHLEGRAGLGRHAAACAWRFRGTIRSHHANVPRAGDAQRPTVRLKS